MENFSAESIIELLKLEVHPEGGFYRQTFKDTDSGSNGRSLSSVIYYLLKFDQVSHWHRVDATEVWFWHSGAPMVITISPNGCDAKALHLGANIQANQKPHIIVKKNYWQSAVSLGEWSLVSCMVSPAFEFNGFEMADENWFPSYKEGLKKK